MGNEPIRKSQRIVADFLEILLVPVLIEVLCIAYFGANYSAYPGAGYGFGLAASFVAMAATFAYFLWRYRNYDEIEREAGS